MMKDELLIHEVGEAIDRAALDPGQWPGVCDAIHGALPGVKPAIYVADAHHCGALDVIQRGFEPSLITEYEQYYSRINPWVPLLLESPVLKALVADEVLPSSTFRETEFYQDWMVRVGDVESAAGIKIVHEPDRIGVLAINYGASTARLYNDLSAHLLQSCAVQLRRAIDVARLASKRTTGGSAAVRLEAFAMPAFLLDGRGRVLELNDAAAQLVSGRALALGFNNALRLGDAALTERIAVAARRIAADMGPWSQGLDMPLTTANGRRHALSLVAVREPPMAGMPAFFAPARLTLLLVRPDASSDAVGPTSLERQFGLTPAERRLAVEVASGLSLRQSADRLGIAYHTARTQLKAVFGKTGVSRQAELVALIARLSADGRPGRSA